MDENVKAPSTALAGPPNRPCATGIVHFGPGAFHRAHQADYIDRLLADDPRWGIAAVSLRSPATVEALARQRGRYTLAILDAEPSFHVLGVHNQYLGPGDMEAIRAALASPATAIVSSTVTEKGYCLAGDFTLDLGHPDVVHDLERPETPLSLVGWLALGLRDRRAARLPAFAVLSCDNMVANGRKLGEAVACFARQLDPELARWIEGEAVFPDTMVDSITPAADEMLRARVRHATGFNDAIPVGREAYCAWVIEDNLPAGGPDLAAAGATLTNDVGAWEKAKLRILNATHSTFAYLGLLIGHETVFEAAGDPALAGFAERLAGDLIASLQPSPLDLVAYKQEIFARFRNPAIAHRLEQIAWDGSQKLPYRLIDPIAEALAAGRPIRRLAMAVAAWMRFVEHRARAGISIIDPLAPILAEAGRGDSPIDSLLELRQLFPEPLAADRSFRGAVHVASAAIGRLGLRAALEEEAKVQNDG